MSKIQAILEKESSLTPEALTILDAISPLLDLKEQERSCYIELFKEGWDRGSTRTGFEDGDKEILRRILDGWDTATPFKKAVVTVSLFNVIRLRLTERAPYMLGN